MNKKSKLPQVECDKNLRDWVIKQARKQDRLMGPYIRKLLTDIKTGKVKLVEAKPGYEIEYRPVENLQTRGGSHELLGNNATAVLRGRCNR